MVGGSARGLLGRSEDTMSAVEAMEKIEGNAFSAVVNLASDFRTFLRILETQPEVTVLSTALQSEAMTQKMLARILELARSPADEAFEHPADAAQAVSLWLLSQRDKDRSLIAAEAVLGSRQCWWARKM